jgi:TQXA domain-containing protein
MRSLREADWVRRFAFAAIATLALVAFDAVPASAVFRAGSNPNPPLQRGASSQLTLSGTGPGQPIDGYIANLDSTFDPTAPGVDYPTSIPPDFSTQDEGFAGVIYGEPVGGGTDLTLYCIDIRTDTYIGNGYVLGTWDEANVPGVGYVARILEDYYPNGSAPTQKPNGTPLTEDETAAAVQAAIWYYSDHFVLPSSDNLFTTVEAIANEVKSQGPVDTPTDPSLTLTPGSLSGPAGSVIGPYTVSSTDSSVTITVDATGANMYSNSSATTPIANGATVHSGQEIWLKSTGSSAATLAATAVATVPAGNVYLYTGGASSAQKLILSTTGILTTTVSATADFEAPGSLMVTKDIGGAAAGQQGAITIHTVCDGTALDDFVIAAGAAAGDHSKTYSDLAAGSVCTVTETGNGSSSTVAVTVSGSGEQHTIPSGNSVTATITDTYTLVPGSLTVNKLITGDAAGSQGAVTIQAVCGGTQLGEWTISANSAAGTYPHTWTGVPANSHCVVTETANGSNSMVSVVTVGSGETVTVGAGQAAEANISDTYSFLNGSLTVTKTIEGAAAGDQGEVAITVTCGATTLPVWTITAGSPAADYTHMFTDIPGGSTCTADETSDGGSSTVVVAISGDNGIPVTVPAGGSASRHITDSYSHATGSLVVTKLIAGPAAGSQDEVRISVTCGSTTFADFVIPAGQTAPISETYPDIPAGTNCTVDETADGSSSTVTVTVDGGRQTVPIVAGQEATAQITDTYDFIPGSLVVQKVIEGPGAGQQGQITITATCVFNGTSTPLSPPLVIAAGKPAGTYSESYTNIPAGSKCTTQVTTDGSNSRVSDLEGGDGNTVDIPAGGTGTIHLTDGYEVGELVINKTITGPAAGLQGEVVIHTVCNGTALSPDFTIAANSPDGTYNTHYTGILAGATCTISETSNGSSNTVHVVTVGNPTNVTISTDGNATADLTDTYTQVPGSLVVNKDITGPAAGSQGPVSIEVTCDDSTVGTFDIAAGATGPQSKTFTGIQAGSNCRVTETLDGSTSTVDVTVTGNDQTVDVPAAGTATVTITDTYTAVNGSLTVNKTIEGPAAGQQSEIVIGVTCDGNTLDDFVIPAGKPAGTYSHEYPDLPAGWQCSVVEISDGSTGKVAVRNRGSGTQVTIPAGAEATVDLTDTYESGALVVNKTITGGAAGSQGEVRIGVTCNEAGVETTQPDFVIPPGTAAGTVSMSYPNILAGSTCVLTETANGATETATVVTVGSPQEVTISENGSATANVVNTYEYVPGTLVVTKDIAGPAAGQQGQVSIGVSCVLDDATTTLDPFVIPAGQPAGMVSHTYPGIPAGSTCTVTETQDGSTATVSVETVGGNQTLAVPARDVVSANISDTYYLAPPAPGGLTVTKTIAGPAAGQQGAITVSVSCAGTALPDFVVPASAPAGTVSRSYTGIAAGSSCTVTETSNGSSSAVHVVTDGSPQTLAITANSTAVANITDTYSNATIAVGSFTVTKNITGPAAGQQGPVTVTASCNGQALSPVLDIPAGATGVQSQTYSNIPAGAVCSATAGPDGGTSAVQVTITGDGNPVTIPAGGSATASLTDNYTSVPGSLLVTKTIVGPAAGEQGPVTVQPVCNGSALSPALKVPAGAAAGDYSQTYEGIPAGSVCTVHETASGSTSTVSVATTGANQTVTVPADHGATALVTDTYSFITGSLTVTKTIAGPAAGHQGAVTVQAACNGSALSPALTVPARAAAGAYSHTYHDITAGSTCDVTEHSDGSNHNITVKVTGDGQHLTVLGGSTATAAVTDTYTLAPSTLVVSKTIAGAAAGQQGPVSIRVTCGGAALTPDLVVPAGTAASTVSHTYTGIPGGSTCDVREMTDGGTTSVSATIVGANQTVTVPAGKVAEVAITDTYELHPGTLTVTKTIAGPAAGLQAPINILADCGGTNIFGLHIPAGTAAGPVPEVFYDIPAGSECKVFEVTDGHSDTVAVVGVGGGQKVKVPAGGKAKADLTDTFSAVAVVTTTTIVPSTTSTTVPSTTTTTVRPTTTTTVRPTTTTTVHPTTTTTVRPTTTTTVRPTTTTTVHPTTTTTVHPTTTTTVPSTTTTTKPRVPPVHVVTGYGLSGPSGPTGVQSAMAGLALLAGGAGILGVRWRRRKYPARRLPGPRRS